MPLGFSPLLPPPLVFLLFKISVEFKDFLKMTETSGGVDSSTPKTRRPRRTTGSKRGITKRELSYEDKCRSLCSLRHSSSSENGRWKASSSSSRSHTSLQLVGDGEECVEPRHSVGTISDSETGSVTQAIDGDFCSTSATSAAALDGMWDDYQVRC